MQELEKIVAAKLQPKHHYQLGRPNLRIILRVPYSYFPGDSPFVGRKSEPYYPNPKSAKVQRCLLK